MTQKNTKDNVSKNAKVFHFFIAPYVIPYLRVWECKSANCKIAESLHLNAHLVNWCDQLIITNLTEETVRNLNK